MGEHDCHAAAVVRLLSQVPSPLLSPMAALWFQRPLPWPGTSQPVASSRRIVCAFVLACSLSHVSGSHPFLCSSWRSASPHISYLMFLFAQSCYGWRGKEEGTGTLPSHLHLPAPRRARLTSRHDSHSWKWDGAGGQGVSVGEKCLCRKYSKWGKLACLLML